MVRTRKRFAESSWHASSESLFPRILTQSWTLNHRLLRLIAQTACSPSFSWQISTRIGHKKCQKVTFSWSRSNKWKFSPCSSASICCCCCSFEREFEKGLKIDFSILEEGDRHRHRSLSWVESTLALLFALSLALKSKSKSGWAVQVNTPPHHLKENHRTVPRDFSFSRALISIDRDRFRGNFVLCSFLWVCLGHCVEAGWCGNNTINYAPAGQTTALSHL